MKKLLAILLVFALILALAACGKTETPAEPGATATPGATAEPTPEPTPAPTTETWYGQSRGMDVTLALASDGTYSVALGDKQTTGAWEEKDGGIVLDGDENAPLYKVNDGLLWQSMGIFLSVEHPELSAYTPAEVLKDGVTAETFNGYWQSAFVDADGAILSAFEVNDQTDVYVEAPRAALGGPLFGDVTVDMSMKDGALSWSEGGVSVKLQLQADGLMRMTLTAPDNDMTLYLMSVYVEGISPAPAEG